MMGDTGTSVLLGSVAKNPSRVGCVTPGGKPVGFFALLRRRGAGQYISPVGKGFSTPECCCSRTGCGSAGAVNATGEVVASNSSRVACLMPGGKEACFFAFPRWRDAGRETPMFPLPAGFPGGMVFPSSGNIRAFKSSCRGCTFTAGTGGSSSASAGGAAKMASMVSCVGPSGGLDFCFAFQGGYVTTIDFSQTRNAREKYHGTC
jgi:hypothetical protein